MFQHARKTPSPNHAHLQSLVLLFPSDIDSSRQLRFPKLPCCGVGDLSGVGGLFVRVLRANRSRDWHLRPDPPGRNLQKWTYRHPALSCLGRNYPMASAGFLHKRSSWHGKMAYSHATGRFHYSKPPYTDNNNELKTQRLTFQMRRDWSQTYWTSNEFVLVPGKLVFKEYTLHIIYIVHITSSWSMSLAFLLVLKPLLAQLQQELFVPQKPWLRNSATSPERCAE